MHENGQAAAIDLGPDRLEQRIRQAAPGDVGQHHDADGAIAARSTELFQRTPRIFPWQRREPANTVRVRRLRLCHRIVGFPCRLATDVFLAPVDVGTGERDDRNVDARGVHVPDAHVVVEVPALRNHDRRVAAENLLLAVGTRLDVVDAAFTFQQLEPRCREHVGVDVDDSHRLIS